MEHDSGEFAACLEIAMAEVRHSDRRYRYIAEDAAVSAILDALESHDPLGGRSLHSWVRYVCRNAIADSIRVEKRRREIAESRCREESGHGGTPSPYYVAMVADEAAYLLSCLPSGHRRFVDLWAQGHTQVEICRKLGLSSQSHVSTVISSSLERIAEFHSRRKHTA